MSYHSDFWIAVATAGPVLSLGHVVAAGTQFDGILQALAETRGIGSRPMWKVYLAAMTGPVLSSLGFVMATVATLAALARLQRENDGGGITGMTTSAALIGFTMVLLIFSFTAGLVGRTYLRS